MSITDPIIDFYESQWRSALRKLTKAQMLTVFVELADWADTQKLGAGEYWHGYRNAQDTVLKMLGLEPTNIDGDLPDEK